MITVTENAATQIKKVQADTRSEDKFLRVGVVDGGCSGHQYQLGFDTATKGDARFVTNGVTLLVDEPSLEMVDGVEIDYVESLDGSAFVFNNPQATGGCGCGKSFSA